MSASRSTAITVASTPFAAFPHIVALSDGRVIQICCPHCNGNAGNRPPFPFFNGVNGMTHHVSRIHKDNKLSSKEYLASTSLRVHTQKDIASIEAGNWQDIVIKRAVAAEDGKEGRVIEINKAIPIPLYPIIIKRDDGSYVQLSCKFCGGNAQTRHGLDRKHDKVKLAFFQGTNGLGGHVGQAHRKQVEALGVKKTDDDWVVKNCGRVVSEDWVEELKQDVTLSKITMVKAKSENDEVADKTGLDAPQNARTRGAWRPAVYGATLPPATVGSLLPARRPGEFPPPPPREEDHIDIWWRISASNPNT